MKLLPFLSAHHKINRPAFIVPVVGSTVAEIRAQAKQACRSGYADLIEWRVDALLGEDPQPLGSDRGEAIRSGYEAVRAGRLPVLATYRGASEGGRCVADGVFTGQPAWVIEEILSLRPDAVDIELTNKHARALIDRAHKVGVAVVVSSHDWRRTPSLNALQHLYQKLERLGADVVKVAVTAQEPEDVLRLLQAVSFADRALSVPVIGMAMGSLGQMSRAYGHLFGSSATFVTVEGAVSAPGQMSAELLSQLLQGAP